jgi:KaiC/GvpD/RAD55 family RecA-like ATPase
MMSNKQKAKKNPPYNSTDAESSTPNIDKILPAAGAKAEGSERLNGKDLAERLRIFYDEEPNRIRNSRYIPTKVPGLDQLLRGGIRLPYFSNGSDSAIGKVDNIVILIKGRAGTGKTTLATQIMLGVYDYMHSIGIIVQQTENPSCKKDGNWIKRIPVIRQKFMEILGKKHAPIIYTCEQTADEFKAFIERFKYTDESDDNKLYALSSNLNIEAINCFSLEEDKKEGTGSSSTISYTKWKDNLEKFLYEKQDENVPYPVVIVDGFNSFPDAARQTLDTQKIIRKLRDKAAISIVVYEDDTSHHENLNYLADIVISLYGEEEQRNPRYYINSLMIEKSRFQQSVLGKHQYKIRSNGFEVFPSLHYRTHRLDKLQDSLQKSNISIKPAKQQDINNGSFSVHKDKCEALVNVYRSSCVACKYYFDQKGIDFELNSDPPNPIKNDNLRISLIEHILHAEKGIKHGSSIAVLGPRHTFKLQSTLDFIRVGSLNGEAGLIITLLDSDEHLKKDRESLCGWLCKASKPNCTDCYENVYVLHLRPGCITPEEFMSILEKRLIEGAKAKKPIRRILIWDIVHLESRFPFFANDPLFLPALIDYLRYNWAITIVFVGPSNSPMANQVTSLVSNLIFTWRDSLKSGNDFDDKINQDIIKILEHIRNDSQKNDFYSFYASSVEGNRAMSTFNFFPRNKAEVKKRQKGSETNLYNSINVINNIDIPMSGSKIIKSDILLQIFQRNPQIFTNALTMRKRIWEMQGLKGATDVEGKIILTSEHQTLNVDIKGESN